MGKIHMGILGPLSQSIGHVTGASVKGKATLRRKSSGGVNPRTEKQVESRSAFGEASEYCRENRAEIIEYCGFKEKKGLTIWNQMMRWYLDGGRLPVPVPYLRQIQIAGNTVNELMLWPHTGDKEGLVLQLPNLFGIPEDATNIQASCTRAYTPEDQYESVWVSYRVTFEDGVFTLQLNSDTGVTGLPIVKGVRYLFSIQYRDTEHQFPQSADFVLDPTHAGPGEFTTYDIPTDAEIIDRLSVLGSVTKEDGVFKVAANTSILPTGNDGVAPELASLCPVMVDFGRANFSYAAYWADSATMAAAVSGRMSGGAAGQATLNSGFTEPVSSALKACFGALEVQFPSCLPWLFSLSRVFVSYTSSNYNPAVKVGANVSGLAGLPAWLSAMSGVIVSETGFAVSLATSTYAESDTQVTIMSLDPSILDAYYAGQQYSDTAEWHNPGYVASAGNIVLVDNTSNVTMRLQGMNLVDYHANYPDGLTLEITHTLQPYMDHGFDRVALKLSGLRYFSPDE